MPSNAPAQQRDRSAPFSQVFGTTDVAAPINLTTIVVTAAATGATQVAPYQNAASELILIPKAATARARWKDCAGTDNDLSMAAALAGQPIRIPVGATELTLTTSCFVIVLWHGNSGQGR